MKVYISPYRDHWIPPVKILQLICFWHVIPSDDDEESPYDDPWIDRWCDRLVPLCEKLQKILDRIHPPIRYVKIDRQDTWSMDHTMAHIIVPMLRQLKATKQGSPMVDLEDVPEHLHPKTPASASNGYIDETVHERWAWVMGEMIWAFEQELVDDSESKFHDHSGVDNNAPLNTQINQIKTDWDGLRAYQERKTNGFRLFGKYYQGLWD